MFDMFIVFIGGGRKGTMQHYISNTNTGMVWFFIIYVVLVGILFLNIFIVVGIIITLFQTSLESSATRSGELDLQFHHHVAGLGEERRLKFYKQLGFLAALLYAPAMKSVNGLLVHTCSLIRLGKASRCVALTWSCGRHSDCKLHSERAGGLCKVHNRSTRRSVYSHTVTTS